MFNILEILRSLGMLTKLQCICDGCKKTLMFDLSKNDKIENIFNSAGWIRKKLFFSYCSKKCQKVNGKAFIKIILK